MPSTTNLEEEEIVDTPGNDGNASMPEQVNRPNPWREMMMMMMINIGVYTPWIWRSSAETCSIQQEIVLLCVLDVHLLVL